MLNEKEQLVDFVLTLAQEFGLPGFFQNQSRESWLCFPLSGIRQAANDMVEATQDLKPEDLAKVDKKLKVLGLPTLSNMRHKGFKEVLKILSRNKLKNEEEWRLVKSISDSELLNGEQGSRAYELLENFEFKST